tara:strand:+ start:1630 stop:1836 length:207 start_codon:yes stop_codon:yes gene_type:complete
METKEPFLQHVFVNVSKRSVKIIDTEGYEESIQWKFDMEGAAGFAETLERFRSINDPDLFTYLYETVS